MNSPVEQIKERLSIVDVVSTYVKLEKAGQNFRACCPFHNEKTPSFFVSPARGSYHCFGCAKGGDIFTFVEDIEGMTFPEALKHLAARAGVTLEKISPEAKVKKTLLYKVLEYATRFYEAHLSKNTEAQEYINKRGLIETTTKTFRIGYAPDGWRTLADYLVSKGFNEKTLEEAGLLVPSARGGYDKFRGRIMFPICDSQGRVVGFTGRIMPSLDKEGTAKYMNSPETALYNKSRILYGYDKAKQAMLREDAALLVEGQMDLLMAHQAGSENVVAVSGTALTGEHLGLLQRFTNNLVMSFDPDEAGFKALERAVNLAFTRDMMVYAIGLPDGLDPADLIAKDSQLWTKALAGKKHFIDLYIDYLKEKKLGEREFVKEITERIVPYIVAFRSPVDQAYYVKKVAGATGLPESSFVEELKRAARSDSPATPALPAKDIRTNRDAMTRKILGILLWEATLPEKHIDSADVRLKLEKLLEIPYDDLIERLPRGTPDELIFEAELLAHEKDVGQDIEELLLNLEQDILEEKFSSLMKLIVEKEQAGDTQSMNDYLKQCQDISKRINDIITRRHQRT